MKARRWCVVVALLAASPAVAAAADLQQPLTHSGGTDKCGCHYNRSTGEYHCHTRKKRGGDCPPSAVGAWDPNEDHVQFGGCE